MKFQSMLTYFVLKRFLRKKNASSEHQFRENKVAYERCP